MSPDKPSPESQKIAESLVLTELVADLYPNSTLLPKDPIQRAKVRFFIETVSSKLIPGWIGPVMRGESFDKLFAGIEEIQNLLPADGKYAIGNDFTIADAAVAPFFARLEVALKNDFGVFAPGSGTKAYEVLETDPKFEKFRKYFAALKARDSFKATFDEVSFSPRRSSVLCPSFFA